MKESENELQKEFELERMILFSDAVFAIAITLLILDVKFPDLSGELSKYQIKILFRPVILHFYAFTISFFFIGTMWAKHLAIFKCLRGYNTKIIAFNLIFLFFIVCFPFTASGFSENMNAHIMLPILLYMVNITCVSVAKAILCIYLFTKERKEVVPGFVDEKKYLLIESIWIASAFLVTLLIMFIIYKIYPDKPANLGYGFFLLFASLITMKKFLKKYKRNAKQERLLMNESKK